MAYRRTNPLILQWAVLFNIHKMLVDRVKAGVERRRRGDDAEPDQDSAWNSNDAVLRQWERIETQDYFRRRMRNRAPVRDSSCCSGRPHKEVKNLAFQIRSSWAQFLRFSIFERVDFSITTVFSTRLNIPPPPRLPMITII